MKKSVITLFSALLVSSAVAVNANNNVNAAQTKDTKNSTASITIKPGDLSIVKPAEDITFSDIVWNGQTNTVSGNNTSVTVGDYRGSVNRGWSLKVNKNEPTDGFKNGIELSFLASTTARNIATKTDKLTVSYDPIEVAYANLNNIQNTDLTSLINLSPSLTVPGNIRIGNDDLNKGYQTTLVWSLATTPESVS